MENFKENLIEMENRRSEVCIVCGRKMYDWIAIGDQDKHFYICYMCNDKHDYQYICRCGKMIKSPEFARFISLKLNHVCKDKGIFICEVCKRQFNCSANLSSHMQTHIPETEMGDKV